MDQLTTGLASARPAWEVRSSQPTKPAGDASRGTGSGQDTAVRSIKPASSEKLKEQIEEIERLRADLSSNGPTKLLIDRSEEAGKFVYRFLDNDTGETVRQWPPEGYLDMLIFLRSDKGGLVNEQA